MNYRHFIFGILLLASAAILSLAGTGCVRLEHEDDNQPETPVVFLPITQKTATKAVIYGEQNATYSRTDGADHRESFRAYAAFTADNTTIPSLDFFSDAGVECMYNDNDYWAPVSTYYWPTSGYLTFRAFSPADLSPCSGTVSNNWTSGGIIISDFTASTNTAQQVDVLYSDPESYRQRWMYTPSSGVYDEASDPLHEHNGVNITFNHALASVQFRVKTDIDYTSDPTYQHAFTIKQIELLNVGYKGAFHENRAWDDPTHLSAYADVPSSVLSYVSKKPDNARTASPYWVPGVEETTYTIYSNPTTGQAVTSSPVALGANILPVPQPLKHATTNKVRVRITFDYTFTLSGTPYTYENLTREVSIYGIENATYNGGASNYTVTHWLIGHRYIYTLVFKLDPLLFDPKVDPDLEVVDLAINLPATISVTGLSVTPTSVVLTLPANPGDPMPTQQLTATISPDTASNQSVTWKSSNPEVATVSDTGLVSAVAAGTATITVTTVDGGFQKLIGVTVNDNTP